jgi:hypothetical protein
MKVFIFAASVVQTSAASTAKLRKKMVKHDKNG